MSTGAALYAHGRAAWPDIALDGGEAAFARHVERHRPPGDAPGSLCIEDLYLACACAQGNDAALRAFDRRYLSQVDHFLPPGDRNPAVLDEIRQMLRDKLLVGRDGAAPKIADYSGRGSLHSWVRTATVFTARNLHRARGSDPLHKSNEAAVQALPSAYDSELDYLKVKYRQEFKDAFRAALASIPAAQRDVVRLHYVEGLNLDRIGARLGINRATAARWRKAAQQAILIEIRRQLREKLRISDAEFNSLVRLVRSQLSVSLPRLLAPDGEPGSDP